MHISFISIYIVTHTHTSGGCRHKSMDRTASSQWSSSAIVMILTKTSHTLQMTNLYCYYAPICLTLRRRAMYLLYTTYIYIEINVDCDSNQLHMFLWIYLLNPSIFLYGSMYSARENVIITLVCSVYIYIVIAPWEVSLGFSIANIFNSHTLEQHLLPIYNNATRRLKSAIKRKSHGY